MRQQFSQRQSQRQKFSQRMALTPSMRQSLQFLAMSTQDLNTYIEEALEKNPFLKKEYLPQARVPKEADIPDYTSLIQVKTNPREELIGLIRMRGVSEQLAALADYLIYEMDENGYITTDLVDVAEDSGADLDVVEEALAVIQELEPAGIGARDTKECLQLQLRRKGLGDALEYRIVTDFLGEVARDDVEAIAHAMGEDKAAVMAAIRNIKKLNPKPCSNILSTEAKKVIPDIIVDIRDRDLVLILNKAWLPQLEFHNPYEGEPTISNEPEAQKFIKDNKQAAKYIIDGLKRRETTLLKVAHYVLEFQKETVLEHSADIHPLTAKDVAHALSMNNSTITRCVSSKYVLLHNKVYPLKDFLSKGVPMTNGASTSKTCIKNTIGEFIKAEDPKKPLTDQKIKDMLQAQGVTLTRRTVTKYREAMKILPTHLRRQRR